MRSAFVLRWPLLAVMFILAQLASAQAVWTVQVVDTETQEALPGVKVFLPQESLGKTTDAQGMAELGALTPGDYVIEVNGGPEYEVSLETYRWDGKASATLVITLAMHESETEEVIIEGTRSNRSIANSPTRVEALTEEIDEASTMDPSKVAHLLTHSTGIQVQQTSATSNTANVRIQGLDGRYTQILKDGFPLYGGFSGSLSIMQIPPLDLRQVEYIKGGASTLYGGGAISGIINLLSKEPVKDETLLHLNLSQLGAMDVNTFVSRSFGKAGFTLLAQRNSHAAFDADSDGFTDLPELLKYNLNPKLFYKSGRNKISLGATLTEETRQGGDVDLLHGETPDSVHFYREANEATRITTQLDAQHRLSERATLQLKNSFSHFHREMLTSPAWVVGSTRFAGRQRSTYSELNLSIRKERTQLITGLNLYTDDFVEEVQLAAVAREEHYHTVGAFANCVQDIGQLMSLEAGLRVDQVMQEKLQVLPRVSALFKWAPRLTTRIGGGMGYRNASIFNQEAEMLGYQGVRAIDRDATVAEQSIGGNADVGYKLPIGEHFFINFNQMVFLTRLRSPLVLNADSLGYAFVNADGYTQSYGAETFFKFGFYDFVLFVGYTYTHASHHFSGVESPMTLTPRHSLKGDLLYALPGKWRIGVDYEYKSSQVLGTGRETRSFWTFGAVVEHTRGPLTLFVNTENFTNIRQTKFESLLGGPYNTPQFTEVWAPLDGFVVNGGIKLRLE